MGTKTGRRQVFIAGAAGGLVGGAKLARGQSAGPQTLVIAAQRTPEGVDPDILKPGNQEIVVQVYEGLTRYARRRDANGVESLDSTKVEGHFAENWDVSEDGRTIRLRLRQGVRSFFGNELTAEDVVWTHRKSMHQRRTGFFIATLSNIAGVEATGRYEVTYRLEAPSAVFFTNLTHYTQTAIDSTEARRHATAQDPYATEWLDRNTCGFGAYHMQSNTPNEQSIFVANPNYFRGRPFFERIVYRAVPSAASRALLIRSGQVQWVENLSIVQVDELSRDPRLRVVQTMHRATAALNMNPNFKPFDDVRVRRAVIHGLDRQAINQAVFMGRGHVANTPVLPIIDGAAEDLFPYPYDPAASRRLLAEAGHPGGIDIELLYADIVGWEEPMAIQAANQLRAANIRVTPRRITPSDMRARGAVNRRDMPFFTSEDGPIVLDIVYAMFIFARTDAVVNRAAHSNPRIDALIDEARQTLDRGRRLALMREAQRLWLEDAPWAMTVYRPLFEIMPANMTGYVYHPDEHERWFDLRRM
jgi:ABC-type transport system substrate-binding protein